jgi:hypothetical protein
MELLLEAIQSDFSRLPRLGTKMVVALREELIRHGHLSVGERASISERQNELLHEQFLAKAVPVLEAGGTHGEAGKAIGKSAGIPSPGKQGAPTGGLAVYGRCEPG